MATEASTTKPLARTAGANPPDVPAEDGATSVELPGEAGGWLAGAEGGADGEISGVATRVGDAVGLSVGMASDSPVRGSTST
jgi:hypothetical protein